MKKIVQMLCFLSLITGGLNACVASNQPVIQSRGTTFSNTQRLGSLRTSTLTPIQDPSPFFPAIQSDFSVEYVEGRSVYDKERNMTTVGSSTPGKLELTYLSPQTIAGRFYGEAFRATSHNWGEMLIRALLDNHSKFDYSQNPDASPDQPPSWKILKWFVDAEEKVIEADKQKYVCKRIVVEYQMNGLITQSEFYISKDVGIIEAKIKTERAKQIFNSGILKQKTPKIPGGIGLKP